MGFATDPSAPLYVAHDDTLLRKTPKAQRRGAQKYGPPLPTPEESLRDESIPWQQIEVFVAQKLHRLKFKVIDAVCWPKATADQPLRLIILKPAGYRLRKGSKLLYRQPAYLICTTTDVALNYLINAYLARWEIEVNFHDEKSILGVGEAQVWNPVSVERTPAFLVAAYAAVLLAQMQAFGDRRTEAFEPLPSLPAIILPALTLFLHTSSGKKDARLSALD